MDKKKFVILSFIFLLYGCETVSEQSSEKIGSGLAGNSGQVVVSDRDADTINTSTSSSNNSALPNLNAQEILEQKFLKIGTTVYFEFDKSTLNSESLIVLQKQAKFLKNYPSVKIIIEGHCDERGTREYNLALGDRRATAVRDFLVANGIDDKRFKIISYGKEKPLVGGSNFTSWAINRRAVFSVVK